ncbi:MAG: hypothetical protein DMF07_12280 [Verrucomicrobia bacterium]|nr:MAG: hypothetical protein DMF07_12280 [Verrucomicrobiota bacterium]
MQALSLGSAGRWPVAFGSLPNACNHTRNVCHNVRGKLPRTTGWQPALPRFRGVAVFEVWRSEFV